MSITLTVPISNASSITAKADGLGVRAYDQTAVIVVGLYDGSGKRIGERRFEVGASTTPSWANFLAACPAGVTFRNQIEAFVQTIDSALTGGVS